MLGTGGNNSADGKCGGEGPALPSPLAGSPCRNGPLPRAAPATLRRQESRRAGQWTRPPAAGAGPVLSCAGKAPGSTVLLPAGLGDGERGGGGLPLGILGRGCMPLPPGSPFPRGGRALRGLAGD